jgi:Protein kinase domain/PEGA domain
VLADEAPAREHRRIGRYRITGRIGRGGMGVVYRGLDEALDRAVAVKTLTMEGTLDEDSRKRFEVEARAAAKLQHPNIVTVFELGEERGMPFIAMELLPGMDLEALMRSGEALVLAEKLDLMVQVCRGLAYAHEHGIVHRDIKPSNIRLLDDGGVKIMDFGIAKLAGTNLTRSGMMVGTVHYMSPEQVQGQPLDGRSDVFSLGVILYELLAGRRPFPGDSVTDVLMKIVHHPSPPLPSEVAGVAPRLQEVLDRALAKNVDERCPSASALAADLAAAQDAHARASPLPVAPPEALNGARRLLKEGRLDECVERLRGLEAAATESVEVRRVLRAVTRERMRRDQPPEPEATDFPELDATYRLPPTQRAAETVVRAASAFPTDVPPTVVSPAGPTVVAPTSSRIGAALGLGLAAGAGVVAAGLFAFVLLRGGEKPAVTAPSAVASAVVPETSAPAPPATAATARKAPVRAASVTLRVASEPPAATVSLDGQRVKDVTPLEVAFDPGVPHTLGISLDGHSSREVTLVPGQLPAEVQVTLEPSGPLGSVVIASSYPLDVRWKGRTLARGQASPNVSLPAGRQVLTLVAGPQFLRVELPVTVAPGGTTSIEAPLLGKINIRANPDTCQVFIDGAYVDYPPILDKAIAAGAHKVSFKWPDGSHAEEAVEVAKGGVAYVTGRKE